MDLSQLIDLLISRMADVSMLAVSGAQGAGKSTLCGALSQRLQNNGKRVVTICLDDVYLSKQARVVLAQKIHPLCAVRGVPGTHDVELLTETLDRLQAGREATALPQFSKANDDVVPRADWPVFDGKPDLIILEGWCVGALPHDLPRAPINALEREQDQAGTWKNWSRRAAKAYTQIWQRCDASVMIVPPGFDAVIDARWAQEEKLFAQTGERQFESRAAVARFCDHYESWTRGLWQHLPARADLVVDRTRSFDFAIRQTF